MEPRQAKVHRITASASPPNMQPPRRGTLALRKSRLVRRRLLQAFYVSGFCLSLSAIVHAGYNFIMEAPYLDVKAPTITGVSPSLTRELEALIGNMTLGHRNILGIDADELEEQLGKHPRIRTISVEKIYPDQLKIKAVERQEIAIVAAGSNFYLMDSEGFAMEKLTPAQLLQHKLPFISGLRNDLVNEGEPIKNATLRKATSLIQVLSERNRDLYDRLSDIEIQTDRASALETLTVHLKGKLDIRFGDSNPVDKLAQLETLLLKLESDGVDPFNDLVYIDMRFTDMAAYMDKITAMDLDMGRYDEIEKRLNAAQATYEKDHPVKSPVPTSDASPARSGSATPARSASGSSTRNTRSAGAAPQAPRATTPQYGAPYGNQYAPQYGTQPGYYQNNAGNRTNYPYNSQQNYSRQYYQPSRNNPAPQNPPMYNLPANQQR